MRLGNLKQRTKDPLRLPREGSIIRKIYNELSTGNPIKLSRADGTNRWNLLQQLINFYNCEIEHKDGHYQMTGRWDGDFFVPVERLGQND